MTNKVLASDTANYFSANRAADRTGVSVLRAAAITAGVCWSIAFVGVGLLYGLQMYGDGSIFSYAVAVQRCLGDPLAQHLGPHVRLSVLLRAGRSLCRTDQGSGWRGGGLRIFVFRGPAAGARRDIFRGPIQKPRHIQLCMFLDGMPRPARSPSR